jgi:hypothetical protein
MRRIDTSFGRLAMHFIEFDRKSDLLVLAPGKAAVWDSTLPLFHWNVEPLYEKAFR